MTRGRSALHGIRLVALDLDGTLLRSSKVLPARARHLTEALREAGIHVTIATGKGWTLTERYALEMLRMAGTAVAPSDAADGVRAAADHVVDGTSDDEAVLRFLEDALRAL